MFRTREVKGGVGRGRLAVATAITVLATALVTGLASAAPGRVAIKTDAYPIWAAGGYGSIWVGAHHDIVLDRIDPATNRITRKVIINRTPCGEPAVGLGAIFVPDCLDEGGNTLEISAKTNKVIRTFPGGPPVLGDNSLWTLDPTGTRVQRFDPRTGVKLAAIPTNLNDSVGGGGEYLGTAGAGAVWLGDAAAKTVLRIDAATNKVVAVIPLPARRARGPPTRATPRAGRWSSPAGRSGTATRPASTRSTPPRTRRRYCT